MRGEDQMNRESNDAAGPQMSPAVRGISAALGSALIVYGIRNRTPVGIGLALVGTALIGQAAVGTSVTGAVADKMLDQSIRVKRSVTIRRPREEIYEFWRKFENLPKFMRHLKNVKQLGEGRSHWVAKAPANRTVEWDAELVEDVPNERIAWRSLAGADVENHGVVRFKDAPGGRGTEVHVELEYRPPAGVVGMVVAKLFTEEPNGQIHDDLIRLRAYFETGEIPTIKGQPSDRVRKAKGLIGTRVTGASLPDPAREATAI
jgi:uncharacterized membrane protein